MMSRSRRNHCVAALTATLVTFCATAIVPGCGITEKITGISDDDSDTKKEADADPIPGLDIETVGVFEVHTPDGLGTGFLVSHEGEIFGVTAFHVVHSEEEILAVKRINSGNAHYRRPIYGEISFTDPDKDIAIMRFDPGIPVQEFLGEPMILANESELNEAKNVESWGITIQRDAITLLHSQDRKITSALRPVSVLDVFTGKEINRNQPQGFSLSQAIPRGFSGGPSTFKTSNGTRVAGLLSNIEVKPIYDDSNAVIVASIEIAQSLEAARQPPRIAELTSATSALAGERTYDIKVNCEKNLQEMLRLLRGIRIDDDATMLGKLSRGQSLFADPDRPRELARFVAPALRNGIFTAEATEAAVREVNDLRLAALDEQLRQAQQIWNREDRPPVCSPLETRGSCINCSKSYMCKSTIVLQTLFAINNALAAISTDLGSQADQLLLWNFVSVLHQALPPDSYAVGASYEVALGEPASISSLVEGNKQRKFLTYTLRDKSENSKQTKEEIRFEYTQGTCLLILDDFE